jgi:ABC-type Fe3+-hydroxamate transport system substrate-binding protein
MKTMIRLALFSLVIAFAACSTTEYIMSTKDGTMLQAYGKPKLDEATGMYTYKDEQGRTATIPKSDVVQIMER